jgi:hypothetical protein
MYRGTISGPVAMHIGDFDFDLPRERIALHPCEPRDAARLWDAVQTQLAGNAAFPLALTLSLPASSGRAWRGAP